MEPEFQIAKTVIEARITNGFSQKDLAQKINTKQSVISRLENAQTNPSISFLKRLATALNTPITVLVSP
jgi:ribosome-binding protein aMBF1 (putative translation factor)